MQGVSYGPVPSRKHQSEIVLHQDDWMTNAAYPQWGTGGRSDLETLKNLGANAIRLYGNSPDSNHIAFLDEAHRQGLDVFPGFSDYPYTQMAGNCATTNFNCFNQVREFYLKNLRNSGWIDKDGLYHKALKTVNIVNEPDLKLPSNSVGDNSKLIQLGRALVSSFDAMLEAEKDAGVDFESKQRLANFTISFSFAMCASCASINELNVTYHNVPGLAQMEVFKIAVENPSLFDYTPINDVSTAFNERFTNSLNAFVDAHTLKHLFINNYIKAFPHTPFYMGEYHFVGVDQEVDMKAIIKLAEKTPGNLFQGVSFFQFQQAYHKGGSEQEFGIFGLGDTILSTMHYFGSEFNIRCLTKVRASNTAKLLPNAISSAYGGDGVRDSFMCKQSPNMVPLDNDGFRTIYDQGNRNRLVKFLERIVMRMGSEISPGVSGFIQSYASDMLQLYEMPAYEDVVGYLHGEYAADFIIRHEDAQCSADRNASPEALGKAIEWICSRTPTACALPQDVNASCTGVYRIADAIFSRYYESVTLQLSSIQPLRDCDLSGTGVLAAPKVYASWEPEERGCRATPTYTATSITTTETPRETTHMTTNANSAESTTAISTISPISTDITTTMEASGVITGFLGQKSDTTVEAEKEDEKGSARISSVPATVLAILLASPLMMN